MSLPASEMVGEREETAVPLHAVLDLRGRTSELEASAKASGHYQDTRISKSQEVSYTGDGSA